METLISSGRIADVILVIMAIEVAVVSFVLWKRQQDLGLLSFVASLLAGGSLILALRAALTDAGWIYVAVYLAAGLFAHLAEIVLRLLVAGRSSNPSQSDVY